MFKYLIAFHLSIAFLRISYILSGYIDLSTEEAQYWLWSKHLDWSYYSKPPLIAYMNAFSTTILGDTEIGVRINAVILGFLTAVLTYITTYTIFKSYFNDKKELEIFAFATSIFIYGIVGYNIASIIFLTDTPLIFFWILTVLLFYKAVNEKKPSLWIGTGVSAGLGFLSKFSMVFFLPPALIYIFLKKREIFREKWFYISILIASLFTIPVIVWNFQHDFVTFKHVGTLEGANIKEISIKKSFQYMGDYILGQIAINSIFLFPLFLYAIIKGFRERNKNEVIYLWLFPVIVFLFFLYVAFKKRVEANWPAFGYATLYILTVYYIFHKKLFKTATVLFILSVISISIMFYTPVLDRIGLGNLLPPEKDPTKRLVGWKELGQKVTDIVSELPDGRYLIFSENYHIASELAFYVKGNPQTYCINLGRRMNQFDLWESINRFANKNYYGVYVTEWSLRKNVKDAFEKLVKHEKFEVKFRGKTVRRYNIFVFKGFKGIKEIRIERY
ncbi:glycosyltransferase family 39 protein [Persephonella sp.]